MEKHIYLKHIDTVSYKYCLNQTLNLKVTLLFQEKNADFSKEVVKKFVFGFYNFRVIEKFKMLRTVEPLYLLYYSAYS